MITPRALGPWLVLFVLVIGGGWWAAQRKLTTSSPNSLVALGQKLFNDPHLSADGNVRCASCHILEKAFTDGRRVAIGINGRIGTRNTPSLAAIGASTTTSFFWDGRRAALEQAVLDPLTNPVEMGLHDNTVAVGKLVNDAGYRAAFSSSFPDAAPFITSAHIAAALSAYVRSLNQRASAFDRYQVTHDPSALSALAKQGLILFSGKAQCAECHRLDGTPVSLTDNAYHRTSAEPSAVEQNLPALTQAVIERSLRDADIGRRVATHVDEAQLGRFNVTLNPGDIGLFRTPSLRNVVSTAPYMHDGSVPTLDEAIDREVYYRSLQSGHPLNLSVMEKQELKAFLEAL
ncbi:cytochrome c peroxidase [Rhodanobacter sp. ANJX3]|uniref:cytochrome-c peroxidase n=1 Tax=unclassified Rhodanobacter TaxID=2621553 RepID=UPI0015CC2A48|nr:MULTISPECIES: cytochrome c peroxidase [unclassified Rhodanobacter]MBB5357043.1 cytochrome c peroxidase [Rhodanobacter sp. ANJX3]NYE27115.1 cytochrome c peroxidase [Rhodanobacter sp. K2T2]